jgi:lysophospholipase L1-like esterase
MRRLALVAFIMALLATPAVVAETPTPVRLGEDETIVFYGDSITEQNFYPAYLETFLASRFPDKKIACFNFGWGGDTARGGTQRFDRDVARVQPTLVFVNFGMNDGGYKPFQQSVYDAYLASQQELADAITQVGAREVLFTTSPIDPDQRPDGDAYTGMLERMAEGVIALGAAREIPVIDLFHPMHEVQRLAKERQPGFTMIPDSVHPNPVGHLVMAYYAMRQIEGPRVVGEITVDGERVTATGGAAVTEVARRLGGTEFSLDLDFLPFYVPPDARPGLDLVPLEDQVNRFRLSVEPAAGAATQKWVLSADGATLGSFTAQQLAAGIDLALLDRAPWCVAGQRLWQASQYRWQKHFEAWRRMALSPDPIMMPELLTFAPFAVAQRAHADAMGRHLQTLAQPGHYRVRLFPLGETLPIKTVALSPTYPFDNAFDQAHPPETDPASVKWHNAAFDGKIDLGAEYPGASNVVAYARVAVEADADAALHLSMGSDDGLAVFLDGKRLFAHDVMRGLRPGSDELLVDLTKGRHDLLFKVTQGGGDFGLAVEAQVYGAAHVKTVR